jgi:hypothetical protein
VYRNPSSGSTLLAVGPAIDDAERMPGRARSASHSLIQELVAARALSGAATTGTFSRLQIMA